MLNLKMHTFLGKGRGGVGRRRKENEEEEEDKSRQNWEDCQNTNFIFFQVREVNDQKNIPFGVFVFVSNKLFVIVGIYPQVVFENHWIKYCSLDQFFCNMKII